jgi:hypothetical protein
MATPWLTLGAAGMTATATRNYLLLTTLALAGALLLAALIIKMVDRWRKQPLDEVLTPGEQLAQFQDLHQKGELSTEEFDRIRAYLGEQLQRDPVSPTAPASSVEGPTQAPETGIRPAQPS